MFEFLKNLFKGMFKKKDLLEIIDVDVDKEKGKIVVKSKKKISDKQMIEIIGKILEKEGLLGEEDND